MFKDCRREHNVELSVVKWKVVYIGDSEIDIASLVPSRKCLCPLDHIRFEIDTDNLSRRDSFGESKGDGTGATATVEQAHTR